MLLPPQKRSDHIRSQEDNEETMQCPQSEDMLTSAIIMATKRLEGYVIPHTNIPYIMVVLRSLSDMECCLSQEHQVASILRVLVNSGLATYKEIEARYGKTVGDIIYDADHEKFYARCEDRYYREAMDDWYNEQHEEYTDIRQHDWRETYGILDTMEEASLLILLAKSRLRHDKVFQEENPMPERFIRSKEEKSDCDRCDVGSCRGYDAVRERWNEDMKWLWYIRRGYTYVKYACPYYEYMDEEWKSLRYDYTPEYMAYCDRCSEEFWQQFGMTNEKAQDMLEFYFPRISKDDGLNDALYHLVVTKY